MSILFFNIKEDIPKNNSLNNYANIFEEYKTKNIELKEALEEMYSSTNISKDKVKALTNDILYKSFEIVQNNYDLIKEKYPLLTLEETQIISSYNCISYAPNFNPYEILNNFLCGENLNEGIINISKYFYIFLKALRKLDRYFLKADEYIYKCIDKMVFLNNNFNGKRIVYKRGLTKVFLGFTSFSSVLKKNFYIGEKAKTIEKSTIFTLYGNFYGYDISPFNLKMDDEIILEP